MGRKRLITDSFQVVKKRKRDCKEVKEDQSLLHGEYFNSRMRALSTCHPVYFFTRSDLGEL